MQKLLNGVNGIRTYPIKYYRVQINSSGATIPRKIFPLNSLNSSRISVKRKMRIGNVDIIKTKQLQNNLKRKVARQQSQLAKSKVTKHRESEGCEVEKDNALAIRSLLHLHSLQGLLLIWNIVKVI